MKGYGNGPSTGLDQTALGKMATGLVYADVVMSESDKAVLQRLAERVAEIAGTDEMAARRKLWTDLNELKNERPVIFCDPENGWNEIITEHNMKCRGKLARRWEMDLRKEIFWGEEMGDDKPVEPFFDVPYTVAPEEWGLSTVFHNSGVQNGSQSWEGPIRNYDCDMPKLHYPSIEIDWATTSGCHDIAKDVFGDILKVRLKGTWWWTLGLTLPAVMLRGMTNMFMDFIDQPDNLKALLKFISDSRMAMLDELEEKGLLSVNSDGTYVGSGGYGFTEELPQTGKGDKVRCCNMWGFAESQETVSVSPDMYEEFIFPFEKPILDRFGLNCYGCCEPIDPRWHFVKRHSNLRRVSCSPWADYEKMAEYLGSDYVFSMKPSPAVLSRPGVDWDKVRSEIRRNLDITRNCVVEVIMKDNHTIACQPENLTTWCRIVREEADNICCR